MAVVDRRAALRVERLHEVRILEDVQPVPAGPLGGDDAGIADPVPVVHRRAAPGIGNRPPVVAAEMAEHEAQRNGQPLPPRRFGKMADIIAEADQHRCAEPRHGLHLLLRRHIAPRSGRHQQGVGKVRYGLADVMTAIDRAEAVDRVDDIVVPEAHQAVGAGQQQVLDFTVFGPVEQGLRHARRARSGVEDGERIPGVASGEGSEGRSPGHARHQVVLGEGRDGSEVIEAGDVARLQARRGPAVPVERHLPGALHDAGEAPLLQRPQCVPRKRRRPLEKGPAHRVVAEHGRHVEAAEQAAHGRRPAMSRLSATQTPSCPCAWSRKRSSQPMRPGRPMILRCTPRLIIFGAPSTPSR